MSLQQNPATKLQPRLLMKRQSVRSVIARHLSFARAQVLHLPLAAALFLIPTTLIAQETIPDVVVGKQEVYKSETLKAEVLLQIHLPEDYSENTEYPVMYLLDGRYFFSQVSATVDFLSDNHYVRKALIPKFIVVGITTRDRDKYYTPTRQSERFPTSGCAELFVKFLKEELFPYVEGKYSTQNKRLITGWSLGGLFTVHCHLNHPEMFDYYLAVSPSLWWDDMLLTKQLTKVIKAGTLSKKRLTITLGTLEKGSMPQSVKGSFLPVMSKAADPRLFHFIEIDGESHDFTPMLGFYKGLQSIFYTWSIPKELLTEGKLDELEAVIFEYARQFGYRGEDTRDAANYLIDIGKQQINYEESLLVAKYLTLKFPESSRDRFAVGEFYYRMGDRKDAMLHIKRASEIEAAKKQPDPKLTGMYKEALLEIANE